MKLTRYLNFLLLLLALSFSPVRAEMVAGVVVFAEKDLLVVRTEHGFTVAELYGLRNLEEGETVVGELHTFGFKELYNPINRQTTRVWIDNYWLSKDRALQWVIQKRR